jgi:archaellum biogenesis ATPase FlaH
MTNIPRLILKKICNDETFARKALPFVKPDYFEGHERIAYDLILNFITKYNALPSKSTLQVEFTNSAKNTENNQEVLDIITDAIVDEKIDDKWMLEHTEAWCKERSVFLGIMKSIQIMDGKEQDLDTGAIPDILQKALQVSFDRNVGHDYIDDYENRFDFYHKTEEKVPFDIPMLNTITNGGITNKTLNIILAGTGVGKSLAMCHFAAAALDQGRNVLYITLEMAEERIAERIDANLMDVEIDQLNALSKNQFETHIDKIKSKTRGRLIIKEYPTASAHTGHFRALLNELELKKDFKPDMIYIDYLNICGSARIKGLGGSVNTYHMVKAIAEEVRGLAAEFNVPIWSATQVTRGGFNSSDVELTDTSESFGLPATADLMLAMISTEQLEGMNQVMFKQLKNRYNDPTKNKRFVVGIDRPKMRLYELDESAQDDVMPDIHEYTIGESASSNKQDFSTFTV